MENLTEILNDGDELTILGSRIHFIQDRTFKSKIDGVPINILGQNICELFREEILF